MTNNYHQKFKRNNKKTCSRRCMMIGSLFTSVIVFLIVAAILPVIFIRSPTDIKVAVPILRWNKTSVTLAGTSGISGNATSQFNQPYDLRLDHTNNMYIIERENHRVQKFLFGSSIGKIIAGNGTLGTSLSLLQRPGRLYLDSNESLYITDTMNSRILFWPEGASNGTMIAGGFGYTNNKLYNPMDIAIHPMTRDLYILDTYNSRTMLYPPGAKNGTIIFGNNGFGNNNTQFNLPCGSYFDAISNSFFIANTLSHNIVRHTIGEHTWTLVAGSTNESSGSSSNRFSSPLQVILDPMGNMYVSDQNNHRIQFFNNGQSNGTTIAGITSLPSNNATTLHSPTSLRLDGQLNLYVVDTLNHRIQKFFRY